jgi:AcrR family transcriptional regulator
MNKKHLLSGRREQKLNTRKRILQAANKLIQLKRPLTMEGIASEAGISRATIYRYYSSTDSIATELILQLNVPNGEKLTEKFEGFNVLDALLGIQETYLDFIFANENPSKKFLGAILSSSDPKLERGQNRITAIRNFFMQNGIDLSDEAKKNLTYIAVLLMGIEAILVTKDVCGLTNEQSRDTLRWGLEMVVKGCMKEKGNG